MPVAVSQVDGQQEFAPREFLPYRRNQIPGVLGDGAHATEPRVPVDDHASRGVWQCQSVEHVVEERLHVRHPFRSAERDDQERVVPLSR